MACDDDNAGFGWRVIDTVITAHSLEEPAVGFYSLDDVTYFRP